MDTASYFFNNFIRIFGTLDWSLCGFAYVFAPEPANQVKLLAFHTSHGWPALVYGPFVHSSPTQQPFACALPPSQLLQTNPFLVIITRRMMMMMMPC
jgi:hypothetical protein